jgi:hypothetical protein
MRLPNKSQWLWFAGLWCAGVLAVGLLAYAIRLVTP